MLNKSTQPILINLLGLLFFFLILTGCSDSKYDRIKSLEKHGYYYSNTGTINRSLSRFNDASYEVVVGSTIIDIDFDFPYITLIRQKVMSELCREGKVRTSIFGEFEYRVVNVETNEISSFEDYSSFLNKVKSLGVAKETIVKDYERYVKNGKVLHPQKIPCPTKR